MKISRLLFLVFRYITLAFVGVAIAFLWEICHLDRYDSWGRFFALWIPLLYGFISTGYVIVAECFHRGVTDSDTLTRRHRIFQRFRNYDDYTYLLPLWICTLIISGAYLKNVYLWLAISYLIFVVVKGGIFLTYLYNMICGLQLDATSQVEPNSDTRLDATSQVEPNVPVHIQCTLVLTVFIIFSLISAYHIRRTPITGDEPHYLLITHSLWHDHDTNLYNNYKNQDYTSFFWYELRPAALDRVNETTVYSYRHKGIFPYTLIPGYVLGGQLGVVLQMNIIAALLVLQVFLLSYELFHSLTASFFAWIGISFTIPVIIYMGQIYPETLAALLMLWGVRRIRMLHPGNSLQSRHFWINCLYIGAIFILLVSLKTRYVPLAGTLLLFLIVHLFQGRLQIRHKIRMAVILGVVLIIVAIVVFLVDTFFLDHMFRDRITDRKYMAWILRGYNPLFGFLGLLFDQEYGLFTYTPLYMICLLGVGMLTRKELKAALPLFGIFALNYIVISLWPLWHGAPTPPSRYILPVLPLLGVFLSRFFIHKCGIINVIVLGTCSIWSFLSAWMMTLTPKWRYNWADGASNLLEMFSFHLAIDVTNIFPSWIRLSSLTPYITALWVVGIGALIYYCRFSAKRSFERSQSLSLEFQVMLVVTIFIVFSAVGLTIGKKLPTLVLETEDALDVRTEGGERVPSTPDPWRNQMYLRSWEYQGWKLFPGNLLKIRPKLPSWKVNIEISARAEFEEKEPADFPVLLVFINNQEVGKTTVTSKGWKVYTFPVRVDEKRPRIEIKHEDVADSKRSIIIDKIRFR